MNCNSLLLRQVHPNFYDGAILTSQAFMPFPKDTGRLSVYDGEMVSPEIAFDHFTGRQGLQSCGIEKK